MPRFNQLYWALCIALTAATACSTAEQAPLVPFDPEISSQWTSWGALSTMPPAIYVLAIDDRASATALRQKVKALVEELVERELYMRTQRMAVRDPAAWHPGDSRVVVVRPSGDAQDSLLTAAQQPGLDWTSRHSNADEAAAWLASINAALTPAMTERDGDPYQLLAHTNLAMRLISGERFPANAEEQLFVDNLPAEFIVHLFIASEHDDTSPLAPISYDFSPPSDWQISVLAPAGDDSCEPAAWETPRLAEWVEAQPNPVIAVLDNSGDDSPSFDLCWGGPFDLSLWGSNCGVKRCMDRPVVVDPLSHAADCQVTLETEQLDRCPEERGWVDPPGGASFTERFNRKFRLCELPQLEGLARQSCRHSLECPSCGNGWCVTEVPELLDNCQAPSISVPLRFVGGATAGLKGYVTAQCSTAQ